MHAIFLDSEALFFPHIVISLNLTIDGCLDLTKCGIYTGYKLFLWWSLIGMLLVKFYGCNHGRKSKIFSA